MLKVKVDQAKNPPPPMPGMPGQPPQKDQSKKKGENDELTGVFSEYNANHDPANGEFSSGGGDGGSGSSPSSSKGSSSGGDGSGGSGSSGSSGSGSVEHATVSAKHTDPNTFSGEDWSNTDPSNGDARLGKIMEMQGFDGNPHVVDDAELDSYVNNGEVEVLRGVEGGHGYAEQFQDGPLYAGEGVYGNGTYTSRVDPSASYQDSAQRSAEEFAKDDGQVLRMSIKADARIAEYDQIAVEMKQYSNDLMEKALDSGHYRKQAPFIHTTKDVGRYAAMKGYDAIRIPRGNPNGANDCEQFIILNRTATRVSHTIRTGKDMRDWRV